MRQRENSRYSKWAHHFPVPLGNNWQIKRPFVPFLASWCKSGIYLVSLILQGFAGFTEEIFGKSKVASVGS